jgi:hypothetical protein
MALSTAPEGIVGPLILGELVFFGAQNGFDGIGVAHCYHV